MFKLTLIICNALSLILIHIGTRAQSTPLGDEEQKDDNDERTPTPSVAASEEKEDEESTRKDDHTPSVAASEEKEDEESTHKDAASEEKEGVDYNGETPTPTNVDASTGLTPLIASAEQGLQDILNITHRAGSAIFGALTGETPPVNNTADTPQASNVTTTTRRVLFQDGMAGGVIEVIDEGEVEDGMSVLTDNTTVDYRSMSNCRYDLTAHAMPGVMPSLNVVSGGGSGSEVVANDGGDNNTVASATSTSRIGRSIKPPKKWGF